VNITFIYRETFMTERLAKDRYEYYRTAADVPLGLGTVRAFAEKDPVLAGKVRGTNLTLPDRVSDEEAMAAVLATEPDIAAFSVYLWNAPSTYALCAELKARRPGVFIVVGGPEIPREKGPMTEFLAEHPAVDAAVGGEGEETFAELAKALASKGSLKALPGLGFRKGQRVTVNEPRPGIEDLSRVPSPYLSGAVAVPLEAKGMVSLETSRGCPFSCAFCNYHAGSRKVREYPLERFEAEIELLKSRGFCGLIYIADPILNLDKERAAKAFSIMSRMNNRFQLELKPEFFDEPSIEALMRIPNPEVALGIQSINPETLKNISRKLDMERATGNIRRILRKEGLSVDAELILGLPGDDYEWMKKSLDWALRFAPALDVTVFDFVLLPNSPMAALKERFKLEVDDEGLVQSSYSFSREDLKKASHLFAAYYYMRDHSGQWDDFTRLMSKGGQRPSDALEKVGRKLVEQGFLPDERVIGQGGRRRRGGGSSSGRPRRWVELSRMKIGMEGEGWW